MKKHVKNPKDELQQIPGIGPSLADDLRRLGYRTIASLRGENPEKMYARFEKLVGSHVDRCVLYTFRCAVYYATVKRHDPEKLKWWNWKD